MGESHFFMNVWRKYF